METSQVTVYTIHKDEMPTFESFCKWLTEVTGRKWYYIIMAGDTYSRFQVTDTITINPLDFVSKED